MRRLITLFSAVSLLSSSVNTIVACGVGVGSIVKINFNTEPQKQTVGTDPIRDYVYNKYYKYDTDALHTTLVACMQLAADKVKIDHNTLATSDLAKDFYNSQEYKSGQYDSINYNVWSKPLNRPFSITDKNGSLLVFGLTENDKTKQQFFGYWFVTTEKPNSLDPTDPNAKTSIEAPTIGDFQDDKKKMITRNGWIHLFLTIGHFKIDFNIRIDVNFILQTDVNKQEIVVVDISTIEKSLGDVDFHHPEYTFDDHDGKQGRISNMLITKL